VAPVLQCPDCGTKHPLAVAGQAASFRCTGCDRVLKVPAQFRTSPGPEPLSDASVGAVVPHRNGDGPARRAPKERSDAVPRVWRFIVWLIALPLAFAIVFGFARVIGILSGNQLQDVFLDTGWDRFWPVARLLPFVALVMAAIVQFSVAGLARLRAKKVPPPPEPPRQDRTEMREPARPAS